MSNDNTCVAYEWQNGQAVYYKNMTIGNSCKSYYSNGAHKDTLPVIKKLILKKELVILLIPILLMRG